MAINNMMAIDFSRKRLRPRHPTGLPNRRDVSTIQAVRINAGVTNTVVPMASSGENSRQVKNRAHDVSTMNRNDNENDPDDLLSTGTWGGRERIDSRASNEYSGCDKGPGSIPPTRSTGILIDILPFCDFG